MKFPAAACWLIGSVGLAAGMTDTKRASVTEQIQARLRAGQFNKELLLKNAVPYSMIKNNGNVPRRHHRHLQDENEDAAEDAADGQDENEDQGDEQYDENQGQYDYQQEYDAGGYWNNYDFDADYFAENFDYDTAHFPISGAYSATFQSCHAIKVGYSPDNYGGGNNNGKNGGNVNYNANDGYWDGYQWNYAGNYNGNNNFYDYSSNANDGGGNDMYASYVSNGVIVPTRSYVFFTMCETETGCKNGAQNSAENTFAVDLKTFVESMVSYFPTQKEQYCEGCQVQADYCFSMYRSQMWDPDADNYEAFWYNNIKYQLIDCSMCAKLQCYSDTDTYEQNGWDAVSQWVYSMAECSATGHYWNSLALYSGFMCNAAGNGVELAVFADNECTMYHTKKNYGNMMGRGSEAFSYYFKSRQIMNYIFQSTFDCYGGQLVYSNAYQPVYYDEDAKGCEDGNEEACEMWEPNDTCASLFSLNANNGGEKFAAVPLSDCELMYGDNYGDAYDDEEEEDAADYDQNLNQQNAYSAYNKNVDVSAMLANNKTAICNVLSQQYYKGKVTAVYDSTYSGSLYNPSSSYGYDTSKGEYNAGGGNSGNSNNANDEADEDNVYGNYGYETTTDGFFPLVQSRASDLSNRAITRDGGLHPLAIAAIALASGLFVFIVGYCFHRIRRSKLQQRLKELHESDESNETPFTEMT